MCSYCTVDIHVYKHKNDHPGLNHVSAHTVPSWPIHDLCVKQLGGTQSQVVLVRTAFIRANLSIRKKSKMQLHPDRQVFWRSEKNTGQYVQGDLVQMRITALIFGIYFNFTF